MRPLPPVRLGPPCRRPILNATTSPLYARRYTSSGAFPKSLSDSPRDSSHENPTQSLFSLLLEIESRLRAETRHDLSFEPDHESPRKARTMRPGVEKLSR